MRRIVAAQVMVGLAGGAGAIAEIGWIRQLDQALGATALALAASAGAFFLAMGAGAALATRVATRAGRRSRALAGLQVAAALFALAAPWAGRLVVGLADWVGGAAASGEVLLFYYLVAAAALAIPGVAAGAVVPLAADVVASGSRPGRRVASLWAWEAVGGSVGALGAGLWLLWWLGGAACFWIGAALHLVAAALALIVGEPEGEPEPPSRRPSKAGREPWRPAVPLVAAALAVSGAAAVGWQGLWSRLMVLALPGTMAWPTVMVASWIGGSAAGAFLYRGAARVRRQPATTLALALVLGTAAAWMGVVVGAWGREVFAASRPVHFPVAVELILGLMVTVPAALALGVALPAGVDLLRPARGSAGAAAGWAVTADVLGAAVATVLIPLALIPAVGLMGAALALGGLQVVAGLALVVRREAWRALRPANAVTVGLLLAGAAAWALGGADLRAWAPVQGGSSHPERVVWGPMATAAVVADGEGALRLYVDRHHGMGGELGVFIERRQGHLPLLLHGEPRAVAVLGVGTGNTLAAVARHEVRHVDAAESLASVLRMIDLFAETNDRIWRDERVHLHNLDGRTMLRRSGRRYDVILSDLVHPWRAGASGLYSLEHLRVVESRLAEGGLFCLWLPLHEMDVGDLGVVAATFLEVFGEGRMLLGHLGYREPIAALVAGRREGMFERERLEALVGSRPPAWAAEVDLESPEDLQSLYLGGTSLLRDLARGAAPTSLDRPRLARRSAATWWRGTDGLGQRTLGALLERRRPVSEVVGDDENAARRHRAVGILLRAELREAAGDLDGAARGYAEAAVEDPTFRLPRLALALLERRSGAQ